MSYFLNAELIVRAETPLPQICSQPSRTRTISRMYYACNERVSRRQTNSPDSCSTFSPFGFSTSRVPYSFPEAGGDLWAQLKECAQLCKPYAKIAGPKTATRSEATTSWCVPLTSLWLNDQLWCCTVNQNFWHVQDTL
jgi:hypothetical protein